MRTRRHRTPASPHAKERNSQNESCNSEKYPLPEQQQSPDEAESIGVFDAFASQEEDPRLSEFERDDNIVSTSGNANAEQVDKFDDEQLDEQVMSPAKSLKEVPFDEETAYPGKTGGVADFGDEDGQWPKEYPEIGDLNCLCAPAPVNGIKDFIMKLAVWFYLNRGQFMSAFTVCITQIPEAMVSAMIVGVPVAFALQGTWIMNIITSLVGGSRPGMVCGATTFVAVALSELKENKGEEYIFYAIMVGASLQILFALSGMGAFVRLLPYPVIQGFSNAMGLVIIAAQFRFGKTIIGQQNTQDRNLIELGYSWQHITDENTSWNTGSSLYVLIIHAFFAFLISLFLPRITRVIPGALVAIFVGTIVEQGILRTSTKYESATIEDFGKVETPYLQPIWTNSDIELPDFSWDTFKKVFLTGLAVFGAGISESLLTLQIVDNLTEYRGNQNQVVLGQGLANMASAMLGGLGGGGSVGQAVIAIHCDGITRLSTFITGIFMMIAIYFAYGAINLVPLGTIAGVMFWSAFMLIDWKSITSIVAAFTPLRIRDRLNMDFKINRGDIFVIVTMMGTTACVDLASGLVAGTLISVLLYSWDSSNRVVVERETSLEDISGDINGEEEQKEIVTYNVSGPLFFATASAFVDIFSIEEIQFDPEKVILHLEGAEIFDSSGMYALKKVYDRFEFLEKLVGISCLSQTSRSLMEKNASMWSGVNFFEEEEIIENSNDDMEEINKEQLASADERSTSTSSA